MTIDAMHGVVDNFDANRFCHRNLVDAKTFRHHLQWRKKYVSLESSLAGFGDALTVDDATVASGRAALMARELGHEVTLYVNPWNVQSEAPLFFQVLNWMLDNAVRQFAVFRNHHFQLTDHRSMQLFRRAVKQQYLQCSLENSCRSVIDEAQKALGVDQQDIDPNCRSLSTAEIKELLKAGVRIENHGWMHLNVSESDVGTTDNILRGRAWLKDHLGVLSSTYAVPFGDHKPPSAGLLTICATWFTLTSQLPAGFVGERIFNRSDIVL